MYYGDQMRGAVDVLGEAVDILGLDDADLLGAAPVKRRALPAGRPVGRATVATTQPQQSRRLPMGIDSGVVVAAGATVTITITPVDPFRPEVLKVDDAIAPSFLITDIKIGRRSQLVGGNPLPASSFAGNNTFNLQMDTAQQSQPIVITVTNTSAAALRFLGTLFGTTVS